MPQSPDYYPNGNEYLKDFPISDQIFKIHNFPLLLIWKLTKKVYS